MECMTFFTTPANGRCRLPTAWRWPETIDLAVLLPRHKHAGARIHPLAGITLVEVMIALTIGSMVAAAAISSFLLLARTGTRAANYNVMATQANRSLEKFAQDVRMASGITWNSSNSITLTVLNSYAATGNKVTYAWDSNPSSTTYRCFYAMLGVAADNNTRSALMHNVVNLNYLRFNRLDAPTTSDDQTKRIQISMTTRLADPTTVETRNALSSASYIMRNKLAN